MLTGGGARAAYQAGLLRGIARHFPRLKVDVITGASAGAINAAFLAAAEGTFADRVARLCDLWCDLECSHIFRFDPKTVIPWRGFRGRSTARRHALFDSTPLRELLRRVLGCGSSTEPIAGIRRNLEAGELRAIALMTLDYSTGQSVRWVQGEALEPFDGPNHRGVQTELTLAHVMASSALPFVFPAVCIDGRWHGDGGIRLAAPLSPAVHLGARRILAMSTGYQRTPDEAGKPLVEGYPPAGQVLSQLVNAVFLDAIDEDVARMERMNEMIRRIPPREWNGFKQVDLMVLRPSCDIGTLSAEYAAKLPLDVRLITRALGVKETQSPDFVSLMLFEGGYTRRLIEIGEADIESRLPALRRFLGEKARALTAV